MDVDSYLAGILVIEAFISNSNFLNIFEGTAISISKSETRAKMQDQPVKDLFEHIRVWQ